MRPQTTAGQGRGLAIGALVALVCTLAPVSAAAASSGATDQYTEQPPSGPAGNESPGNSQQIQTHSPSKGGDRTNSQTAGTPGSQSKVGPPAHGGSAASSDDGDSTLPLVGYPLTTFVAVLLILALVGLAALAAKLSYGRLWGASRSS